MIDITTAIAKLKENNLRMEVVIPTLQVLGIYKVEDWHGSNEQGKDLYFAYEDPFGDYKHCCCFIKAGNITKSGKTDIRKMEGQLKEAMVTKFINPIDNKSETKIEELYILCNGHINREAKGYIHEMIYAHSMPNVRIIDLEKLIKIITKKIIEPLNKINNKQYIFDIKNYKYFCKSVKSK